MQNTSSMLHFQRWFASQAKRFLHANSGATVVEYSLMIAAIALATVVAVELTGTSLRDGVFTDIGNALGTP